MQSHHTHVAIRPVLTSETALSHRHSVMHDVVEEAKTTGPRDPRINPSHASLRFLILQLERSSDVFPERPHLTVRPTDTTPHLRFKTDRIFRA